VDLAVAKHMFAGRANMRAWLTANHITFGREAHMTDDSHRFTPIKMVAAGEALPLHEGKTFHQFTDRWKAAPRYAIRLDAMLDKPGWLRASMHYRLAFREISRSTDDRTMIAAIIPPGHVFGHKGTCERAPWERPDAAALVLCAIFNSFAFDWCVRQKIAASISLFMLYDCPAPTLSDAAAGFLAHCALRLSCGHAGYESLWREQLNTPYVACPGEHATIRAAADAVVACGYGLGRDDYRHILTGFGHKSHPAAPEQCLREFDSLMTCGASAFYRRHDSYERATASAILIPSTPAERIPPA
jgi:hypothetical protein